MSKLHDLITKLCPDGVEYRNLYDVAHFSRGKTITARDAVAGTVPVVAGGQKPAYYHNVSNRPAGTITVAGSGAYAGYVSLWKTPIWLSDAFSITPNDEHELSTAFLYQFLKLNQNWIYAKKKGSGVPHVHGADLSRLQVPVPPIEVQHEVVRILDAFTELEAELEAELTGRKEQYEYYRDRLLDEKNLEAMDGKPVETRKLGEIGFLFGGLTGKTKKDFTDNGNAKFVQYTNIYNNRAVDFSNLGNVSVGENERQNAIQYGDILITCSSETLRDCGMTSAVLNHPAGNVYLNSFCFGWRSNGTVDLMPQFMSYLMRSRSCRKQIIKTANGVTRFNVSKSAFKQIELPVPSLATQERVVDILDRFDALTTSLTDGIPAEIAMRREQYEYYRSRLLDFPRLPEDSDSDGE